LKLLVFQIVGLLKHHKSSSTSKQAKQPSNQHMAQLDDYVRALDLGEIKIDRCCGEINQGVKRPREEHKYAAEAAAGEGEAPAPAPAPEKKQKKSKRKKPEMIALPRANGTFVNVKTKKWGRNRGGTAEERKAKTLADYTEWVNTVLIPAGVDMTKVTGNAYASLIGRRASIIGAYRDAHGIAKQKR
jgi:hypothetical protein